MSGVMRRLHRECQDIERATFDSVTLYQIKEDDVYKWEGTIRYVV